MNTSPQTSRPIPPARILTSLLTLPLLALSASAATYDDWKLTKFTTAQLADLNYSGRMADPDNDGQFNLREFALDSNPKVSDPYIHLYQGLDSADSRLWIYFHRWSYRPNLIYIPQVRVLPNGPWKSGPTQIQEISAVPNPSSGGLTEAVTVKDLTPAAAGVRETRLLVDSDSDGDGLPDQWELLNGLNPWRWADATSDYDSDGFTAAQEFANGTDALLDPNHPDASTPYAPTNVTMETLADGARLLHWEDASTGNAKFFTIRDTLPNGTTVIVARVRASETSVYLPGKE